MQKDTRDKFEILSTQQRENTEQVMMQVKDLKKHFKGSGGQLSDEARQEQR